jgi:DtxR family transcriptional regulator, Mn-dependent transcriptional regulator
VSERVPPEQVIDELLESIWTCREKGSRDVLEVLRCAHAQAERAALEALAAEGLVRLTGECVELTPLGEDRAAGLVRRHRLAERLLSDVLGLSDTHAEETACALEHQLSPEGAEGLSRLLGDPLQCPHGKPIPPAAAGRAPAAGPIPLDQAPCPSRARVAFLRSSDHERIHQLLSMGLAPGVPIRLHQRSPVLVLEIEQSELALDREVARDVHVWLEEE